ncbi:hypothetical protein NUACC21_58620 [Scytonema sp. NUACC21]
MVERPIKKSDRQPKVDSDNTSENSDSLPPVESNAKPIKRIGDRKADSSERRSSGKGKKGSFAKESKQQVNPALARGPKPAKPKPDVITEPETASEVVSEGSQGETAES